MNDLLNRSCVGHDQIRALSLQEITEYLTLINNWEFLETGKIVKEFEFDDFVGSIDFINNIAKIAEEEQHHPDIEIKYSKVTITLSTHFVKGLSENDFIMAAKIDNILSK